MKKILLFLVAFCLLACTSQTNVNQTYKQGTLHMVKNLDLVDMRQMALETLPLIFNKAD